MPIPIATQVLAFLQYAAGNSFQLHIADSLGISIKSLSNCINRVATSLADQADQFIRFLRTPIKFVKQKLHFPIMAFAACFNFVHFSLQCCNVIPEVGNWLVISECTNFHASSCGH